MLVEFTDSSLVDHSGLTTRHEGNLLIIEPCYYDNSENLIVSEVKSWHRMDFNFVWELLSHSWCCTLFWAFGLELELELMPIGT